MESQERKGRLHSHGCSVAPDPYQLIACTGGVLFVAAYSFLVLPLYSARLSIALGTAYFLNFALTVFFWLRATLTDPTDSVILAERKALALSQHFDSRLYKEICTICTAHVNEDSKHCGKCNRCVEGFDHHCKWLNNCIGLRNYRFFALLITVFAFQLLQQTISSLILLCSLITGSTSSSLSHFYSLEGSEAVLFEAILGLFTCLTLICLLFLTQLILLHVWLRCKGLTTYEYIMSKRQRKYYSPRLRKLQPELKAEEPGTQDRTELPEAFKAKMFEKLKGRQRGWSEDRSRRGDEDSLAALA